MRTLICGQPHDDNTALLRTLAKGPKRREIIHQHRLSPEKRVDMFEDLSRYMQETTFTISQKNPQSKPEYHKQMATPQIAWSGSAQETLGIGICIEAPLFDVIPFAPTRLSYVEIFKGYPEFLYPSLWTESWDLYVEHRSEMIQRLNYILENYDSLVPVVRHYCENVLPRFASGSAMIDSLLR